MKFNKDMPWKYMLVAQCVRTDENNSWHVVGGYRTQYLSPRKRYLTIQLSLGVKVTLRLSDIRQSLRHKPVFSFLKWRRTGRYLSVSFVQAISPIQTKHTSTIHQLQNTSMTRLSSSIASCISAFMIQTSMRPFIFFKPATMTSEFPAW